MTISLTPELERFIQEQMESGRYSTAAEVVEAGLRLLSRDEMREAIAVGVAQFHRGEVGPLRAVETLARNRAARQAE